MEISTNNICYRNLQNIKVKFKEGLINGILGNSCSGKSSLADIISTYSMPSKGHLEIDSIMIDNDNPMINYAMIRFEIGYVPQNPFNMMFCDTVKEQFMFHLNQYNYKNNDKHILDSLKMVSLSDSYLNRKINTLSDGELFKLSLAITLSLNPKVIILDEPFTYLDNNSKKSIVKLLRVLKNRFHKTIIILSNNVDNIYELCDYIYILSNNKILIEGTKYDIFKHKSKLIKNNINLPKIIEFEQLVEEKKNIKMGYRDNINDLLKDIYFYCQKF